MSDKTPKPEYSTYGLTKTPDGWTVTRVKMRGKQVISVEELIGPTFRGDAALKLRLLVAKAIADHEI